MDRTIKVRKIATTWSTCDYRFQVWVEDTPYSHEKHEYVLETLRKWFGTAEYFWKNSFLCDRKA